MMCVPATRSAALVDSSQVHVCAKMENLLHANDMFKWLQDNWRVSFKDNYPVSLAKLQWLSLIWFLLKQVNIGAPHSEKMSDLKMNVKDNNKENKTSK